MQKKILITESQLKRILLKEDDNYAAKALYMDDAIGVYMYAPKTGATKLGHGSNHIFSITVLNKTKSPMVLRVTTNSDWGIRGETNLKFTQEPISPSGGEGNISFKISGKKGNNGGYNNTTLIVTYYAGKKQKTFNLSIPFEKPNREETLNYCKGFYNDAELSKAKQTLLSWLNNPVTIEKYMKNWNKTKNEVTSIFNDYKDVVKKVGLKYVIEPDERFLGRIVPKNFNTIFSTPKFLPIEINCVEGYLKEGKEEGNIQPLLIHEMQHLLDLIHKWHPEIKSPTRPLSSLSSLATDVALSPDGKEMSVEDQIVKRLMKDGFKKLDASFIASDYVRTIERRGAEYTGSDNELASFILGARTFLGLKPGQNITAAHLSANKYQNQIWWLIQFYIQSGLSLQEFLGQINSYAKNTAGQTDTGNV